MIAQEFALQYPERVRKLILGCTACGGPKVVRANDEVNRVLMARGNMTLEEGIEAMVPYIYDSGTPRARIEKTLPSGGGRTRQQRVTSGSCRASSVGNPIVGSRRFQPQPW
jgi:pimeloyl-ACP methyl ester carboxylesterase